MMRLWRSFGVSLVVILFVLVVADASAAPIWITYEGAFLSHTDFGSNTTESLSTPYTGTFMVDSALPPADDYSDFANAEGIGNYFAVGTISSPYLAVTEGQFPVGTFPEPLGYGAHFTDLISNVTRLQFFDSFGHRATSPSILTGVTSRHVVSQAFAGAFPDLESALSFAITQQIVFELRDAASMDTYVNGAYVSSIGDLFAGTAKITGFSTTDPAQSVPEPTTGLLLVIGTASLAAHRRRRATEISSSPDKPH